MCKYNFEISYTLSAQENAQNTVTTYAFYKISLGCGNHIIKDLRCLVQTIQENSVSVVLLVEDYIGIPIQEIIPKIATVVIDYLVRWCNFSHLSKIKRYIDFSHSSDPEKLQNKLNEVVKGFSHFGFPIMQDDLWQAQTSLKPS
jgi:hypothetical protein